MIHLTKREMEILNRAFQFGRLPPLEKFVDTTPDTGVGGWNDYLSIIDYGEELIRFVVKK